MAATRHVHLVADFLGVRNESALKLLPALSAIVSATATDCKLNVINSVGHQFQPHGATCLLLLSESHFSAHTYVESEEIHVDIFCCSKDFDCQNAIDILKRRFDARDVRWTTLRRPCSFVSTVARWLVGY